MTTEAETVAEQQAQTAAPAEEQQPVEAAENAAAEAEEAAAADAVGGKQNRQEKKSRKALSKLGLKPVEGISRVTIRKNKQFMITVSNPEVLKAPASDTYVILGEGKVDDLNSQEHRAAAEQFKAAAAQEAGAPEAEGAAPEAVEAEAEEEGEVDLTGLDEKDVNLVVEQAHVSRAKAAKVLREKNGDIVEAIMVRCVDCFVYARVARVQDGVKRSEKAIAMVQQHHPRAGAPNEKKKGR